MTKITFRKSKDGEYLGFECLGHAGFAGFGKDIVCASISVLVINTINSLDEIVHENLDVVSDDDKGLIKCIFLQHPIKDESKLLMESLLLGLTQIEQQYGRKYCKLTFEEV